jgi:steroid 5-alpha reductase family enzyme
MQIDALMQGLANASYLTIPAFIIGSNPNPNISIFEIIGLALWIASFVLESIADNQKLRFLKQMKADKQRNKVCEIGLWQYTRHPNYFAEWLVWNALIIIAIPSWLAIQSLEPLIIWILLGFGLLYVSLIMYNTLVYITGAKPSEYYSLQKRPDYKSYKKRVNMFFPGFPKKNNRQPDL